MPLPVCRPQDQHSNMVEYHVPIAPGGVADIFDQLESNKATLQIKHFSVSQTTLDEVRREGARERGSEGARERGSEGGREGGRKGQEQRHSLRMWERLYS